MKSGKPPEETAPAPPDLEPRLAALDRIRVEGRGRLSPDMIGAADALSHRIGTRLRHGTAATVVALAGATGSGKSSLFNALVAPAGEPVVAVGVRRPTTEHTTAAIFSSDPGIDGLLDWLEVGERHRMDDEGDLGGLVLLDLPDHDSIEKGHRLEVDRLVEVVDLLVWVLDPQKYADEVLHRRYLGPLHHHGDVMMFALNQSDLVADHLRDGWRDDAVRILERDGLTEPAVVMTSTTVGDGLPALREALGRRIADRTAALVRIDADLRSLGTSLSAIPMPPVEDRGAEAGLIAGLTRASGAGAVGAAVADGYRYDAVGAVGWPFTRWVRRFRRHPVHALRSRTSSGVTLSGNPPTGAAAIDIADLDMELRAYADVRTGDVTPAWRRLARNVAMSQRQWLSVELGEGVSSASLGPASPPRWWAVVGAMQWALAACLVIGLAWLAAAAVLGYLQIPDESLLPEISGWPLPTLVAVGGGIAGLALAAMMRLPARIGARRRRDQAMRDAEAAITSAARSRVIDPVNQELDTWTELRSSIEMLNVGAHVDVPEDTSGVVRR